MPINQGENLSVIRTLGGISPGTVRALNEPWRPVDPTPTPTVRPQFKQLPKLTHQLSQFFLFEHQRKLRSLASTLMHVILPQGQKIGDGSPPVAWTRKVKFGGLPQCN